MKKGFGYNFGCFMGEKKGASMKKYGASKKKFPEIKEKNEGKFTKWVEKNMPGTDTCKAASKIMRSKTKKYSLYVIVEMQSACF